MCDELLLNFGAKCNFTCEIARAFQGREIRQNASEIIP